MNIGNIVFCAALVGLCSAGCLASGCSPSGETGDSGKATDTGSGKDTGSVTDTGSATDTGTGTGSEADSDSCLAPGAYPAPEPLVWISIKGGTFVQGQNNNTDHMEESPAHQVTVPSFEIMKNEVTMAQYAACMKEGPCTAPGVDTADNDDKGCNWCVEGTWDHPVNCVDWNQADAYCKWIGARLPTESEWEYAARSGGKEPGTYPWGEQEPTCDYAVFWEDGVPPTENYGCKTGRTWPICSKPLGDTEQGLCDMAGNVQEWNQDWYAWGYDGAPTDGSARKWEPGAASNVMRGGSFKAPSSGTRTRARGDLPPIARGPAIGLRCARDAQTDLCAGTDAGK
jgi:formylglycine-generating enzyme required for sulfatase activity